jgi:glycosyltransferase involved in cell wall biosynthesis
MTPIRLTIVLTHPVQYYAPWFRHIAAHSSTIHLTVLYGTSPTAAQQGVGFGRSFEWDVPVRGGYKSIVVRDSTEGDSLSDTDFWGVDSERLGEALLSTRPDIVLVPGWHSALYVRALAVCRRHHIPVLYRGDTHFANRPSGVGRLVRRARTRLLLRSFEGFLSVGRRTKEYLLASGATPWRIFDVPHAVDNEFFAAGAARFQSSTGRLEARERFGLPTDTFVALFVGKCDRVKRPLDVVRAAAAPGARAAVLLVGDGRLAGECASEAARLGVVVARPGFLNQAELPAAYAAADCLVLPSESETWGLVVNEALATGLPCIVSDRVGCAPDLVNEETGAVFRMGDVASLSGAIDRVRSKAAEGHDYASACRRKIAEYSFDVATAGLDRACREILQGDAPDPRVVAWCGHMVAAGGMERITFEALRTVRSNRGFVHCIVNDWENHRITAMAERAGATWSTVRARQGLRRRISSAGVLLRMVWEGFLASVDLLRWQRRLKATHIFLPDYAAAIRTAPALAWLRLRGVPIVLRLGNAPETGRFYRFVWRWLVDPVVDSFVCNSRFTASVVLDYEIPSRKVRVVRNTLPSRQSTGPAAPERADIIYVGQIIPEKGVDVLLEAVALTTAAVPSITVNLVGQIDGWISPRYTGYREAVQRRAEAPDLKGKIRFLGWREDIPQLMAASRLHCCPSLPATREGFGIVVVEAKAAGIPSVVFPSGALPELIRHPVDGWVCRESTAGALADGLRYFLSNPERLNAAGIAARQSLPLDDAARFATEWRSVFARSEPLVEHRATGVRGEV